MRAARFWEVGLRPITKELESSGFRKVLNAQFSPVQPPKNYNKRNARFVLMEYLQCLFSAENDPERLNSV
jgi:hypothetical protein